MNNETRSDQFVFVNEEGLVRELTPGERAYIKTDFHGADSGRPLIKGAYEERNGWGDLHGFLRRDRVPPGQSIGPAPESEPPPLDLEALHKIAHEKFPHWRGKFILASDHECGSSGGGKGEVNQFIRLTLRNIPWFVGIFVLLIAVGYLQGDLKLSSIYWPGFIAGLALTIVAVSAVGAGQALFRERREKRRSSG